MLFPDAFAAALSDRTTALAAAFIIATRHADVLQFVARTIGVDAPADVEPLSKPRAAAPRGRKANGHRKPRDNAGDRYLTRRRAQRDEDDSNLLAAMRRNTEATIGELATAVGKSRTSIVSALHRLRNASLADSSDGRWRLTEEPPAREPIQPWIPPLKGPREQRVHATA